MEKIFKSELEVAQEEKEDGREEEQEEEKNR